MVRAIVVTDSFGYATREQLVRCDCKVSALIICFRQIMSKKHSTFVANWRAFGFYGLFITSLVSVIRADDFKATLTPLSSYRQTTGTILSSYVWQRNTRHGERYHAEISYRYQVDGKSFWNNKISFVKTGDRDRVLAQNSIDKYPKYKRVTVYYRPENPASAILEPKTAKDNRFLIASLFAAFIGCFAIVAWSYRVNENSAQK